MSLGLAGAQAVQWREAQLRLCVLATGAALAEVCSASSGLCVISVAGGGPGAT